MPGIQDPRVRFVLLWSMHKVLSSLHMRIGQQPLAPEIRLLVCGNRWTVISASRRWLARSIDDNFLHFEYRKRFSACHAFLSAHGTYSREHNVFMNRYSANRLRNHKTGPVLCFVHPSFVYLHWTNSPYHQLLAKLSIVFCFPSLSTRHRSVVHIFILPNALHLRDIN